jgi:ATP-dependent DNA ligase
VEGVSGLSTGVHNAVGVLNDDFAIYDWDFESLGSTIRWAPGRLLLYAFDLLLLDGKDLRDSTLLNRRAKLKQLLPPDETRLLQFSEEFTGDAAAFFRACAERHLEGVVSKLGSPKYRSGRSKTWLKTKCFTESAAARVFKRTSGVVITIRNLVAH